MGLVGWKYKREIQLINTTLFNLENYIVGIILDSGNFDFSKARFDGSDIRFTDSDGITLLDYYVEDYDYNNREAMICVKIPSIPANQTKSIYMYYGNPNAVSQSDQSIMNSGFQYNPDPFNDGSCVAYYPFDGDANDYSGNGHHGTWHGNEQYDKGIFGQCAKFDGNSYITLSSGIDISSKIYTISAWVKDIEESADRYAVGIINKNTGDYTNTIYFYQDKIYLGQNNSDPSIDISIIQDGNWHHLVGIFNNGNTKLYVDNVLKINAPTSSNNYSPLILIANRPYGGNHMISGLIDHVRVFNRALTDDEISLLSTHIPSTILGEVQVKSRASGVIVDTNGNPIINTPIKIYLLNPDTGHLVDSTDCNTDASWEINDVPAEPGEEVISVFKSNDSSQKLTGASVVVTQEVNE